MVSDGKGQMTGARVPSMNYFFACTAALATVPGNPPLIADTFAFAVAPAMSVTRCFAVAEGLTLVSTTRRIVARFTCITILPCETSFAHIAPLPSESIGTVPAHQRTIFKAAGGVVFDTLSARVHFVALAAFFAAPKTPFVAPGAFAEGISILCRTPDAVIRRRAMKTDIAVLT
jgi:hypothetical protein